MATTLAFPPRIVNGAYETVQEGSDAEILGNVDAILLCPLGHRPLLPDFGRPPLEHTRLRDDRAGEIAAAVLASEPRVTQVLTVEDIIDRAATISVQLAHA